MKGDVGVGECGGGDGEFDKARWVGGEERKQCEEGEGEEGAVRCINKRAKAFEKKEHGNLKQKRQNSPFRRRERLMSMMQIWDRGRRQRAHWGGGSEYSKTKRETVEEATIMGKGERTKAHKRQNSPKKQENCSG